MSIKVILFVFSFLVVAAVADPNPSDRPTYLPPGHEFTVITYTEDFSGSPMQENQTCPDGETECPIDFMCCPVDGFSNYSCCPFIQGECCKNTTICCAAGYNCCPSYFGCCPMNRECCGHYCCGFNWTCCNSYRCCDDKIGESCCVNFCCTSHYSVCCPDAFVPGCCPSDYPICCFNNMCCHVGSHCCVGGCCPDDDPTDTFATPAVPKYVPQQ